MKPEVTFSASMRDRLESAKADHEPTRLKTAAEVSAFLRAEAKRLRETGDRDGALALFDAAGAIATDQYRVIR